MATRNRPLRIGLDLDGVILYNPARIVRPAIVGFKKLFVKGRVSTFYVPHKPWEKRLWYLFHKSSLYVSPGFWTFKRWALEGRIELYIITARYSFLKPDLEAWMHKIGAHDFVKEVIYNSHDEQPHLYKEKIIRRHKLDIFVEDNWDVVKHLVHHDVPTRVFWIYNILDRRINYPFKYPHLKAVAKVLQDEV